MFIKNNKAKRSEIEIEVTIERNKTKYSEGKANNGISFCPDIATINTILTINKYEILATIEKTAFLMISLCLFIIP